jgi:hypothetical protein
MEDFKEPVAFSFSQASTPRQRRRRLLMTGGIALVLTLTLGAALVATRAQAAGSGAPGGVVVRQYPTRTPGVSGSCGGQLTVTNATNKVITVTGPNGNSKTIYVTAHTHYVKAGQAVTASAVQVGSHIFVTGNCTHGQTIKATRIEIVG